jgi:ubiquinone/menaquinone biosynthesis C-methylase UbiE
MSERDTDLSQRALDADLPELKPFLKPGMSVLDVGCGPGTITLGVAAAVNPGTVVGIDPSSRFIDLARKRGAQIKYPGNITFQVGDSHHLDFPDETFDVVYSNTVIHFFLDPAMALKEQRRVAKKGGWVIASGVRDWGGVTVHPPSPNWDKVLEACLHWWDAGLTEYRGSGKDPVSFLKDRSENSGNSTMQYMDAYAGRKCLGWFNKAGLSELRIEIHGRVQYQEHRDSPPSIFDLVIVEEPKTDVQRSIVEFNRSGLSSMISTGLLDLQTVELAEEEVRAWYKDPGAFRFFPEFFVAGRKV